MSYNFDKYMQEYFDSLPALIQETIKRTGINNFETVEDMKSFVQNMNQGD